MTDRHEAFRDQVMLRVAERQEALRGQKEADEAEAARQLIASAQQEAQRQIIAENSRVALSRIKGELDEIARLCREQGVPVHVRATEHQKEERSGHVGILDRMGHPQKPAPVPIRPVDLWILEKQEVTESVNEAVSTSYDEYAPAWRTVKVGCKGLGLTTYGRLVECTFPTGQPVGNLPEVGVITKMHEDDDILQLTDCELALPDFEDNPQFPKLHAKAMDWAVGLLSQANQS
jgi:hypothetical protein